MLVTVVFFVFPAKHLTTLFSYRYQLDYRSKGFLLSIQLFTLKDHLIQEWLYGMSVSCSMLVFGFLAYGPINNPSEKKKDTRLFNGIY